MLGGHVANWAGLSGFSPQENKISRTFFIDFINTLRPRQNGRHFADDIFKRIFLNENIWISIKISLKFVPKGSINNISALVQIMAWRRPGDKPLSEPMMVNLPTHICVTRPQWVNKHSKVSNVDNSDDCHGVFNDVKQRLKFFTIALRLLGFDAFLPWVILICAKFLGCQTKENIIKKYLTKFGNVWEQRNLSRPRKL